MKPLTRFLCAAFVLCLPEGAWCDSVTHEQRTISRVQVHVVTVDLNDRSLRLDLALAEGMPRGAEPFAALVEKSKPLAAINGTFFDKKSFAPVADLVKDGRLVHFGGMGTAMAVDAKNNVTFRRVPWGRRMDWSAYETVLACGPSLILRGHPEVDAEIEGFSDDHVLNAGARSAVGVSGHRKLRLVCVPTAASLSRLSAIMQKLGCTNAMNLDGGASTALYCKGKTIVGPGRELTNLLIVRRRTQQPSLPPPPEPPRDRRKESAPSHVDEPTAETAVESSKEGTAGPAEGGDAEPATKADETATAQPNLGADEDDAEGATTETRTEPDTTAPSDWATEVEQSPLSLATIHVTVAAVAAVLFLAVLGATRKSLIPQPMGFASRFVRYAAALPMHMVVGMAGFGVLHTFLAADLPFFDRSECLAYAAAILAVPLLVTMLFGPTDATNCAEVAFWMALVAGLVCYANERFEVVPLELHLSGWRLVVMHLPSAAIMGAMVGWLKGRIARRTTRAVAV